MEIGDRDCPSGRREGKMIVYGSNRANSTRLTTGRRVSGCYETNRPIGREKEFTRNRERLREAARLL